MLSWHSKHPLNFRRHELKYILGFLTVRGLNCTRAGQGLSGAGGGLPDGADESRSVAQEPGGAAGFREALRDPSRRPNPAMRLLFSSEGLREAGFLRENQRLLTPTPKTPPASP